MVLQLIYIAQVIDDFTFVKQMTFDTMLIQM